jgi:Flp pilus assembly protein TadD
VADQDGVLAKQLVKDAAHYYLNDRFEEAEKLYLESINLDPSQSDAWMDLALVKTKQGYVNTAVVMLEKAIQQDRSTSEAIAYCNLGNTCVRTGRLHQAALAFDRAIALGMDSWTLYLNRGVMHLSLGFPDKAIPDLERSFNTIPQENVEELTSNLGYAYAAAGELKKGFQLLGHIWTVAPQEIGELGLPMHGYWEPFTKGKRVLVFHNQGNGDTIQFARFLPEVRLAIEAAGSEIVVAIPKPLVNLFQLQPFLKGITVCDTTDISITSGCDEIFAMSMIPPWCGVEYHSLPSTRDVPIVAPRFDQPVPGGGRGRLKVGVAWAARADHGTGLRRTIPFKSVLELLSTPGVDFYALQAGEALQQVREAGAEPLIHLPDPPIWDFLDLAKWMQEMDIVVSADTAPLHLAGAMNIPCIGIMSRDASDWRWLEYPRADSPWYPSMRLFRQPEVGDWITPITQVIRHLTDLSSHDF